MNRRKPAGASAPTFPILLALVLTAALPGCSRQPAAKTAGSAASAGASPADAPAPAESAPPAAGAGEAGGEGKGGDESAGADPLPRTRGPLGPGRSQAERQRAMAEALLRKAAADNPVAAGPREEPRDPNQPPDGVWLVDEQNREYYIERMPRLEGKYSWVNETKVMYFGVPVDIVDADEDFFSVKVYRTHGRVETGHKPPTMAEIAAVEATYAADLPVVDRLRFIPFGEPLSDGGQWRNGFDIADIDGDGHLDIVHGPQRKGVRLPVFFRGDGAGGWTPWRESRFHRYYDYGDAAAADFNGDGHMDLALGIHLHGVRVLINNGNGDFTEWSDGIDFEVPGSSGFGNNFSSRSIEPVDWDGDGRMDLLALGEGPRMANPTADERRLGYRPMEFIADGAVLFLNQGDGSWKKVDKGADRDEIFGDYLAVGDFDGDGRPDFVTSSNRMTRKDLVNRWAAADDWRSEVVPAVRPNAYVRAVRTADFDGDGRDDVVLTYIAYEAESWRNGIDVLLSRDGGEWERRPLFSRPERLAFHSLGVGDVDGDGTVDVLAFDMDGYARLFLGGGDGSFVEEESPELDQPFGFCRGYAVETADFDGDGADEVVASFADESSAFYDPDRCPTSGGLIAWTVATSEGTASR